MKIQILPLDIINKIAAGEVVEKPANAVKEVVENAIDANSTSIKIELEQAGRNLIRVTDNGIGISKEDLCLSVEKHATSKLNAKDLYDINYLGFRGEALHSIAVTSEMKIASSCNEEAHIIDALTKEIKPHHVKCGTIVEIRNLFHNIPNKLRFLRSEKTELSSIIELLNKLALVNPHVAFELISNGRQILNYRAGTLVERMEQLKVLGKDFVENLIHVQHSDGNISGELFLGLPTLTQTKNNCFTFVNRRPVKDSIIASVIRHAYNDYIPKNAYPVAIVFITLPNHEVDVNIHPNKSEVKFQDPQAVRKFIIGAVRRGLSQYGTRSSTTITNQAFDKFTQLIENPESTPIKAELSSQSVEKVGHFASAPTNSSRDTIIQELFRDTGKTAPPTGTFNRENAGRPLLRSKEAIHLPSEPQNSNACYTYEDKIALGNEEKLPNLLFERQNNLFTHQELRKQKQSEPAPKEKYSKTFGMFKCQIHGTFIITETENEMIIIDQHAAHERILYEQMKNDIAAPGQNLLIAEFIPLDEKTVEILLSNEELLKKIGLTIERVSHDAVMVYSLPTSFRGVPIQPLIDKISSLLEEDIDPKTLLERIYANIACKRAIKANHILTGEEVDELLTLMENTLHTGQCNHGRPTHIRLPRKEIEKLFLRS